MSTAIEYFIQLEPSFAICLSLIELKIVKSSQNHFRVVLVANRDASAWKYTLLLTTNVSRLSAKWGQNEPGFKKKWTQCELGHLKKGPKTAGHMYCTQHMECPPRGLCIQI